MPELPEVECVRQGLERFVVAKSVEKITVNRRDLRLPVPENFESLLTGRKIVSLKRRGKYIIFEFDQGAAAFLHLGMSGRVRIYKPQDEYKRERHDHVLIRVQDGTQIVFHDPRRFGMFVLSCTKEWYDEAPFVHMGAEPLEAWSGNDLFQGLKGRKASIKIALLNQEVVSGLGNIYVCEALFGSGIHPMRVAGDLDIKSCENLVTCVRDVLRKAIKAGGSTLKDYQHTDGTLGGFQNQFMVYGRENQNCRNEGCSEKIIRIIQAGRSTFYCSGCQK